MGILKAAVAHIRYRKEMKKASKQLGSCMEIYERNEKRILELEELFKKDAEEKRQDEIIEQKI